MTENLDEKIKGSSNNKEESIQQLEDFQQDINDVKNTHNLEDLSIEEKELNKVLVK